MFNLFVCIFDLDESYEIDMLNVVLVVNLFGVYCIDVDECSGIIDIIVLDGQVMVYGVNDFSCWLIGGYCYCFDDNLLMQVVEFYVGVQDVFDLWCVDCDDCYVCVSSCQYVVDDVIGYEDFDCYGQWQSDDVYGQVWYLVIVVSDWVFYCDGYWVYVVLWGWIWIDDVLWGFVLYYYGCWINVGGCWGWILGLCELCVVYVLVLVVFVGGNGWSVLVGVGVLIGWFLFGLGDFYNLWYWVSVGYYCWVNWYNLYWDDCWYYDYDCDGFECYFNECYCCYCEGCVLDEYYVNCYVLYGIIVVLCEVFVQVWWVEGYWLQIDLGYLCMVLVFGCLLVSLVYVSFVGVFVLCGWIVLQGCFD